MEVKEITEYLILYDIGADIRVSIWLFVVIFNISFTIGLPPGGLFSNSPTSQSPVFSGNFQTLHERKV